MGQIEHEVRARIIQEIHDSGEIESQIHDRVSANYEKKLAQEKRKMKLEYQAKEAEMQETMMHEFEVQVKERATAITSKRELDIQRKFRI